ncbi:hypothetical protein [Helicobacter cynogastricus]|uniref:hypothetical protein n=1 Tax=Helicobacter cynogastricus TaxID=329937 RepID=UPI000CF0D2F5|nr:hypothetical protein [Helicobacter cynogastricus]
MIKLLKKDFLEHCRPILGLYLFLILCWEMVQHPAHIFLFLNSPVFFLLASIFFISGFIALFILMFLALLRTTQQDLFGKQAFLTWCLPLSVDRILIAKIASNLVWAIFGLIVLVIVNTLDTLLESRSFGEFMEGVKIYLTQHGTRLLQHGLFFSLSITLSILKILAIFALLHSFKIKRGTIFLGCLFFILLNTLLVLPSIIFHQENTSSDPLFTLYILFPFLETQTFFTALTFESLKIIGLYVLVRYLISKHLEL